MRKTNHWIGWVVLALAVLVPSVYGQEELRIDIGQSGGTVTPEVGFQAFTANVATLISNNYVADFGTGGGSTITVGITSPFYRSPPGSYIQVTNVPGFNNLLSGATLLNSDAQTMTLSLSNLADGDYALTTFHHSNYSPNSGLGRLDVFLTDANNTSALQHTNVPITIGASPTSFTTRVTNFTVSGGSSTTFLFDGVPGTDGNNHSTLNAFILNDVTAGLPAMNVDFGAADNNGGGPGGTQSGFQAYEGTNSAVDVPNSSRFLSSLHGANGLVQVGVTGATHFRDYASLAGTSPAFGDNALLSDMVLRNADGQLTLTLSELLPGDYEITTYHHSTQFGGGTFDVQLTDADNTDAALFMNVLVSSGIDPTSISSLTFQFTSDGSPVMIDFLGGGAAQHFSLNGFSLQRATADVVPEPTSVATWLLVCAAWFGVILRRCRRAAH